MIRNCICFLLLCSSAFSSERITKYTISFRGHQFVSYSELKESPVYQEVLKIGNARKAVRTTSDQESLEIMRKWRGKSMVDWDYHERLVRGKKFSGF